MKSSCDKSLAVTWLCTKTPEKRAVFVRVKGFLCKNVYDENSGHQTGNTGIAGRRWIMSNRSEENNGVSSLQTNKGHCVSSSIFRLDATTTSIGA